MCTFPFDHLALLLWFPTLFHSIFEGDPERFENVSRNIMSTVLIECSHKMVIKSTFPTALVCFAPSLYGITFMENIKRTL